MIISNSVSWMIPCLEVLYFAFSLFDNQLLMSAILFLIHFQRTPYFNTKAVEPGLTVNSDTQDVLLSKYSNEVRIIFDFGVKFNLNCSTIWKDSFHGQAGFSHSEILDHSLFGLELAKMIARLQFNCFYIINRHLHRFTVFFNIFRPFSHNLNHLSQNLRF